MSKDKPTSETKKSLEEMEMKDLQEKAIELGFPNPEIFTVKKQLIAVIDSLEGKQKLELKKNKTETLMSRGDAKKWSGKALIMKKKLDSQEKVSVFLSLNGKEKPGSIKEFVGENGKKKLVFKGAIWAVVMNGHVTYVPKGIPAMVPSQVQEALGQSQAKTAVAGQEFLIDREEEHEGVTIQEAFK